jgi:hypothetical protein
MDRERIRRLAENKPRVLGEANYGADFVLVFRYGAEAYEFDKQVREYIKENNPHWARAFEKSIDLEGGEYHFFGPKDTLQEILGDLMKDRPRGVTFPRSIAKHWSIKSFMAL